MGSFLDSMNQDEEKLESFEEEQLEEVKVNKFKKYGIPGIIVAAVAIIGFIIYNVMTSVTVPDMVGWSSTEVEEWADTENITIIAYEDYYFDYDADTVVSQNVTAGETIHTSDAISLTFSKGADPYEVIVIPDINQMTESEVKAWIAEYQLTGVTLDYVNSTVFEKGAVIDYEFVDGTETNFIRKNRMVITISDGIEAAAETVTVDDFVGLSEGSVGKWATSNGVLLEIEYVNDTYYDAGLVISQNVAEGYDIKVGGTLKIIVSLGEEIKVADFSYYTKSEATAWGSTNGVTVNVIETYSESIPAGAFITQSVEAGTSMSVDDSVNVEYSLGKIKVYTYVGKSILDFESFIEEVNLDGASISYTINYQSSTKYADGMILSHDYINTAINPGTSITVTVSLGDDVEVPDFTELSLTEAKAWGIETGVTISVKEVYSKSVPIGVSSYQSIADGEMVSSADSITVYYSLGQPSLVSYVGDNVLDLIDAIEALNEDGASLYYTTTEIYSNVIAEGNIIDHTYENEKIYPGSTIAITVSKGPGYIVPDFSTFASVGFTSGTIDAVIAELGTGGTLSGYNIAYSYVTPETTTSAGAIQKGDIVDQSYDAGTVIGQADMIILYVANADSLATT